MSKSIEVTQELERKQETALITPTDLNAEATRNISAALNAILAGRVRALPEDQKLPLAHERTALPRLPSAV